MPNECEALLSDGSDLVAEQMRFGLGWNSTSTTCRGSQLPGCPPVLGLEESQDGTPKKIHITSPVLDITIKIC